MLIRYFSRFLRDIFRSLLPNMTTQGIERIPDSLGYLVINEDGAVVSSGGDLENDERLADRILTLVHKSLHLVHSPDKPTTFKRVSVIWDNFLYAVTISNHKVYVSKRRHLPTDPAVA